VADEADGCQNRRWGVLTVDTDRIRDERERDMRDVEEDRTKMKEREGVGPACKRNREADC
jgi:hypothetical protein